MPRKNNSQLYDPYDLTLVRSSMPTAVFDFDETLVYLPSVLVWSKNIHFRNMLQIPVLFILGIIAGVPSLYRKAFEWMVGKDVSQTIEQIKNLPPIPGALNYFQQLSIQGYKMIVMSYSPGVFVRPWLTANGLNAELICPDFVISANLLKMISEDPVTKTYLKGSYTAKARVLSKMNIKPDICVGDNERRDRMCDQYIDIKSLEPNYKNILQQMIDSLEHILG